MKFVLYEMLDTPNLVYSTKVTFWELITILVLHNIVVYTFLYAILCAFINDLYERPSNTLFLLTKSWFQFLSRVAS
jgi:hypothetical protein